MTGENDTRLGADEREQLRGRVLDGIPRPRRSAGALIASGVAVIAVAVVVTLAWSTAASRPAPVAQTPTPTATESPDMPSTPEGLWTSDEVEDAYLYLDPDGSFVGSDGCNVHGGTWDYTDRDHSVVAFDGYQTLRACMEEGDDGTGTATLAPENLRARKVLSLPAGAQATGNVLGGENADGETVELRRDPRVEVKDGTILARLAEPQEAGDGALLEGALTRTESGVLGIGATPVVFPAGTRLLDGGQGIEVAGVGEILLGDEVSLGGGTTSRKVWGPPLPYDVESFLAWQVTR